MAQADIKAIITADDRASATLKRFSQTVSDTGTSATKTSGAFSGLWKQIGAGALVFGAVSKGISVVTGAIGDAIKRVDTLNNANRTFQNMGFHADVVASSMKNLNKSILGLPTSLDQAVTGVTLLSSANNDLAKAQQVYSAMNDAILGFGGNAVMVQNAVLQLSQDMAGGVIHAGTWNSMLQSGLGPTLAAMARQMHITTAQLRDGLSDGSINVKKFEDALISMDKNGGGGLKSLHQIAMDSTKGISTSMANARTAIVRSLATIIQSIGQANIADAITAVGKAMSVTILYIGRFIGNIKELISWLEKNKKIFMDVYDVLVNYFTPPINNLIKTFEQKLLPAMKNLWKAFGPDFLQILKKVAEAVGVAVVGAIWLAINALNVLMSILTPAINWIAAHKQVVLDLAAAFIIFRGTLMIWDVIDKLRVAMATLQLVTIPGLMAKIGALRLLISSPVTMGPIAIAAALADIALVMKAVQSVIGAINAMNQANDAKAMATDQGAAIAHQKDLFNQHKITKAQETKAINALLAGVDSVSHHAGGGPVNAGQPYVVGEHGQELFVPNQAGRIVPNGGGGQTTVNIAVNAGAFMGSHIEARKYAIQMYKALQDYAKSKNTTVSALVVR